jgi:hypothetical protein
MSLSISRLEMEDLHMYEVSFSYPVTQEEGFGDPSTPDAEEVRVCSDQRSTGLDGDVIALVALLLAGPIQVTSQYVYDRYFKPREPQSNPSQDVERNVPNAYPDKWVVNGYPLRYETTNLRASYERH